MLFYIKFFKIQEKLGKYFPLQSWQHYNVNSKDLEFETGDLYQVELFLP